MTAGRDCQTDRDRDLDENETVETGPIGINSTVPAIHNMLLYAVDGLSYRECSLIRPPHLVGPTGAEA